MTKSDYIEMPVDAYKGYNYTLRYAKVHIDGRVYSSRSEAKWALVRGCNFSYEDAHQYIESLPIYTQEELDD